MKVIYDNELFHARTILFFNIDTEINSCLLTMDIVSATERGSNYKLKTLGFCFSVFFLELKVYIRSNVEEQSMRCVDPKHNALKFFFKGRCHRIKKPEWFSS